MTKIEKRRSIDGREVRFTNFIDHESIRFESEAEEFMANVGIEQRLRSFGKSGRDFFIMQMRGKDGSAAMQACIHIGRPRGFSGFSMATVPKLSQAKTSVDEEIGLEALREFCAKIPRIMTLRLQPERFDPRSLMDFQAHGVRRGYQVSNPLSIVRTRIMDLYGSEEELSEKLCSKSRSCVRNRGREKVELRTLTDKRFLETCRDLATAARERTGGGRTSYDFEKAFALALSEPDRAHIIGLFLKSRPDELLAYVIGFCRGSLLELSMGGSLPDAELRTLPFNYFVLWDLIAWGRKQGCTHMDMGGISDGGPFDPLRGIAHFKRSFPGREVETGREMLVVLKPIRFLIYRILKSVKEIMGNFSVAYD